MNGSFSFSSRTPNDPRIDPATGGGSLWDVGCYPVSFARRLAGEEPDGVGAFARFDERGIDRTFVGQLHFPSGLLAQFDSGFAAPTGSASRSSGGVATWSSAPRSCRPDGPPPGIDSPRPRRRRRTRVESTDQYRAEVDDLTAAILDGTQPRVSLAFSRGSIDALVDLDRAARANAGLIAG